MSIEPPSHIPGIVRDPSHMVEARKLNTEIPLILPHERVFPIQIGSELFRLSGASISSDGMYILSYLLLLSPLYRLTLFCLRCFLALLSFFP